MLTGFGLGTFALQALADSLTQRGHHTQFLPLPSDGDLAGYVTHTIANHGMGSADVVLGWSLGGQIASLLAQHSHSRLVTLASNPKFVADHSWPHGMDAAVFQQFQQQQGHNPSRNVQQFAALAGLLDVASDARSHIKALKQHLPMQTPAQIAQDQLHLTLLAQLDTRPLLVDLSVPTLHVFAQNDALIPCSITQNPALPPSAQSCMIAGASHLLPLTHTAACVAQIEAFLQV